MTPTPLCPIMSYVFILQIFTEHLLWAATMPFIENKVANVIAGVQSPKNLYSQERQCRSERQLQSNEIRAFDDWSEQASLRKWYLSWDLKDENEPAICKAMQRVQAEVTRSVRAGCRKKLVMSREHRATRDQGWMNNGEERIFEMTQGLVDHRKEFRFCCKGNEKSEF